MFNTLFTLRLGGREVSLHTYGILIAVGLAAGIFLAHRQARRQGWDGGRVLDAAFWMIVAGLIGSRVVYGIVNAGDFARICFHGGGAASRSAGTVLSDCTRILAIWQGGLVFYGGVAGAALVGYRFARREGWSFASFGDLFAPALALGHAFGRLGCYAAGCCFGKVSGSGGAHFPRGSVAFDELASAGAVPPGWQTTPGLHRTQLYEAVGELLIFAALLVLRPRVRKQPGTLLVTYLGLYALLRFFVEIFRGDVIRGLVISLDTPRLAHWLHLPAQEPLFFSVGQLGSLIVFGLCAVWWARLRRQTAGA